MSNIIKCEKRTVELKIQSLDAGDAARQAKHMLQRWLAAWPGRVAVDTWYTEQELPFANGETLFEAMFTVTVYDPIEAAR